MSNGRAELERFKVEINLSQFAAGYGCQLDKRASSRNSAVMRNLEGDKIIVAREGQHWVYFSVTLILRKIRGVANRFALSG